MYLSVYKGRRAKALVLYLITDYNLINAGMKSANVAEKNTFSPHQGLNFYLQRSLLS